MTDPVLFGYNPLPEATTFGKQLIRSRTMQGLSQKHAAKRLDVDPGTLARWERGEREPRGAFLVRVNRFLKEDEEHRGARRVGNRYRRC